MRYLISARGPTHSLGQTQTPNPKPQIWSSNGGPRRKGGAHAESLADAITELLLIHTTRFCRLLDLQTMLVRAGGEYHGTGGVAESGETREDVGEQEGVEVAYVRGCTGSACDSPEAVA